MNQTSSSTVAHVKFSFQLVHASDAASSEIFSYFGVRAGHCSINCVANLLCIAVIMEGFQIAVWWYEVIVMTY